MDTVYHQPSAKLMALRAQGVNNVLDKKLCSRQALRKQNKIYHSPLR
jgi:hypothetical protein